MWHTSDTGHEAKVLQYIKKEQNMKALLREGSGMYQRGMKVQLNHVKDIEDIEGILCEDPNNLFFTHQVTQGVWRRETQNSSSYPGHNLLGI